MTRTERQQEAINRWIKAKGRGTWEFPTAFGKTYTAIQAIQRIRVRYPDIQILVVVPTLTLKDQWIDELTKHDVIFNVEVVVINTVIKHSWTCDLLIIDEIHTAGADEMSKVFSQVKYKKILGLTATFERLDGKHALLAKFAPIVDVVSTEEAILNGWISTFTEYEVLIDVEDLDLYKSYNKEFQEHFEFFQFDFDLAMKCVGPEGYKQRLRLRDEYYTGDDPEKKSQMLKAVTYHAMGLMQTMTKRKSFINNHPEKIYWAQRIMNARPDSKIITFSNNVKMAEALENSQYVYTGKTTKAKGRVMIEDFLSGKINHLHSCKRLIEGFNDPEVSVGIILGMDSSERRSVQTRGRIIRKVDGKKAEIFNLVIKGTQEEKWFRDSHKTTPFITIDTDGLEQVLRGETPDLYLKKQAQFTFRF